MAVSGPPVVAFLSTGRCGTQWLTEGLRSVYPGVDVEHEPLGPLYRPRMYFRRYDDREAILEVPEVATHLWQIEHSRRPYIETGWPLFPALPLMSARLSHRLRIVHLTRHPVPSALSHLAHNTYAGSPRDDAYTQMATIAPTDPGVFRSEYAERWDRLVPYEKCLYWWTEVHQYALELPLRIGPVRFLRIQSERLLAGEREPLERLLEFMGLPWNDRWLGLAGQLVDRWHHHSQDNPDPLLIHRHAATVDVARRLGYDASEIDFDALEQRYRGEPDPGLDRIGRFR